MKEKIIDLTDDILEQIINLEKKFIENKNSYPLIANMAKKQIEVLGPICDRLIEIIEAK